MAPPWRHRFSLFSTAFFSGSSCLFPEHINTFPFHHTETSFPAKLQGIPGETIVCHDRKCAEDTLSGPWSLSACLPDFAEVMIPLTPFSSGFSPSSPLSPSVNTWFSCFPPPHIPTFLHSASPPGAVLLLAHPVFRWRPSVSSWALVHFFPLSGMPFSLLATSPGQVLFIS